MNQEERSKAMIRFMVFFTVTLILTVFAFYFDVLTRNESAEINREKLKRYTNSEKERDRLLGYCTKTRESINRISFDPNKPGAHELAYQAVKDTLDKFKTEDTFLAEITDELRLCMQQMAVHQRDNADRIKNGETLNKKDDEIKGLKEDIKELEGQLEDSEEALKACEKREQ
ncbi:MAG: hypothetical protein ACK478_10435 [Flavobacteriales bacterium]